MNAIAVLRAPHTRDMTEADRAAIILDGIEHTLSAIDLIRHACREEPEPDRVQSVLAGIETICLFIDKMMAAPLEIAGGFMRQPIQRSER